MEYNSYYATPPPMSNQPGQQVHLMPASGAGLMHVPSPIPQPPTPQNIRQVVTPVGQTPPMSQHMPQQHMNLHHQHHHHHHQMAPIGPQQPQPHNYHQHQQLPLQHQGLANSLPPPPPHSASPASLIHSPHQHNLQPPPRPPTGPSPHPHMHQHSPHPPPPPPMHLQPQLNQIPINGPPGGPPQMLLPPDGQPPPLQPGGMHHAQGFGPGSSPMQPSHGPSPHYSHPPPPGPTQHHPSSMGVPPPPHSQGPPPNLMGSIHHPHNLHQPHLPPGYVQHQIQPQNHLERGSPFYQNLPQTEFRIIELNKRLQNRPRLNYSSRTLPFSDCSEECYWWEKFASDFFDDDSTLTLRSVSQDEKIVEYKIGRTLIPRFFRSYFAGGVIDLSIKLRNSREITHNPTLITLECDQTDITTKNVLQYPGSNLPMYVIVHTEGHLSLEFVNNFDTLSIKSWRFYTSQCREYIDRSMTNSGLSNAFLTDPVTRYGLTKQTLSFLKMCMIMEPMQELMFHHKQTKLDPRSCLRHLLVDKYKLKTLEDPRAQPPKRRKRRTPATTGGAKKGKANNINSNASIMNNNSNSIGFNNNIGNNLMSPSAGVGIPNMSLASQDVMVVGEPSMLGADFGDENERRITRLENNQFDPQSIGASNNVGSQNPNQICNTNNSNQNTQALNNNSLNHMQQPQQQQTNNLDIVGNTMQMMNHANPTNNGTSEVNNASNSTSNSQLCIQNSTNIINNNNNSTTNNNSHQMNLISMNGNISHTNHIVVKTELDLKQSTAPAPTSTDPETR